MKRRLLILTALYVFLVSCSNNGSSEIPSPDEPSASISSSGITSPTTTNNIPAPSTPSIDTFLPSMPSDDLTTPNIPIITEPDEDTPSPDTPTPITQNPSVQHLTSYEDILDAFRDYVYDASRDSQNENEFPPLDDYFGEPADDTEDVLFNFYSGIGFAVKFGLSIEDNMQNLGYAIKDINGDGVPELILLTNKYSLGSYILGVFSYANNKPQLLGGYWNRHSCRIDSSGLFYYHRSGGAWNGEWAIQQISTDNCQLVDVKRFVRYSDYEGYSETMVVNGEAYTPGESEIELFFEEFRAVPEQPADLQFIPLADDYAFTK